MTTEEKLQHFQKFCMEDARTHSAKMLDEYTAALEETFSEHQTDARRWAKQQVELESERIKQDTNKALSLEQIGIRRELGHKQEELKDKIFTELKDTLLQYRNTSGYTQLLEKQIKHAMDVAGEDALIIYIDPADEAKLNLCAYQNRADIRVSEYSFMGGTRAIIISRHILIDNSFQTKLEEAKRDFHFNINDLEGGAING